MTVSGDYEDIDLPAGGLPDITTPSIRPGVMHLARAMEEKLREDEWKGGWAKDGFPQWFLGRLRDEVEELDAAVDAIRAYGVSDGMDDRAEAV